MRTDDKEKPGFTYSAKEAIRPILHAQACVKAIESIGGDPETVGELVSLAGRGVEAFPDTETFSKSDHQRTVLYELEKLYERCISV